MSATLSGRPALLEAIRPPRSRLVRELGWWNLLGGLAGSTAMAVSGSALLVGYDGGDVRWWFGLDVPPRVGDIGNYLICYIGMLGLLAAWFGTLRRIRRSTSLGCWDLAMVGLAWAVPLVLGPPLFSRDIYSYLAQGMLAHLRLSPYTYAPQVLGVAGFGKVASAVSPVWRLTTVPYGPVFVWVAGALAGASGGDLSGGILLLRLPEIVGIALAAATLPPLARRLGADPREALWIGAMSPLALFELLSSGHNDALMVGLVMVGLLMALDGKPLLGVAACSVGTLVKLPALAGAVFIAWTWAREQEDLPAKLRAAALAAVTSGGVLLAGSGLTDGFGWVSMKVLSVPNKVSTQISPTRASSSVLHLAAGALGLGVNHGSLLDLTRAAGMLVGAVAILVLLARARSSNLVPSLGAAMVVAVLLGTDAWPWYLTWGVLPLAAWRPAQRSWWLLAAAAVYCFVVTPTGRLVIPSVAAPAVAVAWLVLAVLAWRGGLSSYSPRALLRSLRLPRS